MGLICLIISWWVLQNRHVVGRPCGTQSTSRSCSSCRGWWVEEGREVVGSNVDTGGTSMVVSGAGSLVGAHDVVPWVDDAAARVGRLERIDAAIPALYLVDKSLSFP